MKKFTNTLLLQLERILVPNLYLTLKSKTMVLEIDSEISLKFPNSLKLQVVSCSANCEATRIFTFWL